MVNMTVRYEHSNCSLRHVTEEKAKKYQHLLTQIQDLTNTVDIELCVFPQKHGESGMMKSLS